MPISIKSPAAQKPVQGAHDKAAEQIESEVTTTKMVQGQPDETVHHEYHSEPVMVPPQHERIEIGMAFKMPVAQYTMLEFSIRRSVPFNPLEVDDEDVYSAVKTWVEGKINALIEEQQTVEG